MTIACLNYTALYKFHPYLCYDGKTSVENIFSYKGDYYV